MAEMFITISKLKRYIIKFFKILIVIVFVRHLHLYLGICICNNNGNNVYMIRNSNEFDNERNPHILIR